MVDTKSNLLKGMTFSPTSDLPSYVHEVIDVHSGTIHPRGQVIAAHGSGKNALTVDWLLACAEQKRLLPATQPLFKPIRSTNIEGITDQTIVLFRLDDETRHAVGDLVRAVGGAVSYRFVKTAAFVVALKPEQRLMEACLEAKVPIVRPGFVHESVRTGTLADRARYVIENSCATERLHLLCDRLRTGIPPRQSAPSRPHLPAEEREEEEPVETLDVTYEPRVFVGEEDPLLDVLLTDV